MILRTAKGSALTYEEMDANLTYLDTTKVNNTTAETISGVKTFTSPIQGNLVGNATSASKLQTARTINGVLFDGTQNIVLPAQTLEGVTVSTQAQTFSGVKTFSDGLITNISGNSGTSDKLKVGRKINGIIFDGSQDIIIPFDTNSFVTLSTNQTISGQKTFAVSPTAPTPDSSDNSTKLATTGFVKGVMASFTLPQINDNEFVKISTNQTILGVKNFISGSDIVMYNGVPENSSNQIPNTKWVQEVFDKRIGSSIMKNLKITSGSIICNQGLKPLSTNIVGYIPEGSSENYGDVYPPAGYSMSNLLGFLPSMNLMWQSITSDTNDVYYCRHFVMADRIRIQCAATEQRQASVANYIAIWNK